MEKTAMTDEERLKLKELNSKWLRVSDFIILFTKPVFGYSLPKKRRPKAVKTAKQKRALRARKWYRANADKLRESARQKYHANIERSRRNNRIKYYLRQLEKDSTDTRRWK